MISKTPFVAVARVPAGAWAVAVSGGADSVGLLFLLRQRADLALHVVHLDHETRAGESARDAAFVEHLARDWNLACTVARRSDVERGMEPLPSNQSGRYRAARLALFRRVVGERNLDGILLAHHADDQAETVALRLLRGASLTGLRGMSQRTEMQELVLLRPLLDLRRQEIREVLESNGIAWREDASNESLDQARNRIRHVLRAHGELVRQLLRLREMSERWVHWLQRESPALDEAFRVEELQDRFPPAAEFAARMWLAARANDQEEISADAAKRLVEMAMDAASPAKWNFPGGITVRRRRGVVFVDETEAPSSRGAGGGGGVGG
ncbi:MAG TPA: tRNA lysidine(34) synthetase TilS [Tepidisphaeraceae bacterium]|jgi:tRNA(Ile)-lysidine synthase